MARLSNGDEVESESISSKSLDEHDTAGYVAIVEAARSVSSSTLKNAAPWLEHDAELPEVVRMADKFLAAEFARWGDLEVEDEPEVAAEPVAGDSEDEGL